MDRSRTVSLTLTMALISVVLAVQGCTTARPSPQTVKISTSSSEIEPTIVNSLPGLTKSIAPVQAVRERYPPSTPQASSTPGSPQQRPTRDAGSRFEKPPDILKPENTVPPPPPMNGTETAGKEVQLVGHTVQLPPDAWVEAFGIGDGGPYAPGIIWWLRREDSRVMLGFTRDGKCVYMRVEGSEDLFSFLPFQCPEEEIRPSPTTPEPGVATPPSLRP